MQRAGWVTPLPGSWAAGKDSARGRGEISQRVGHRKPGHELEHPFVL